ncbi:hypothetical protein E2320_010683, partial [Naja naja]
MVIPIDSLEEMDFPESPQLKFRSAIYKLISIPVDADYLLPWIFLFVSYQNNSTLCKHFLRKPVNIIVWAFSLLNSRFLFLCPATPPKSNATRGKAFPLP